MELKDCPESFAAGWDAAVAAAAKKAMVLQDGFRGLLKDARRGLVEGPPPEAPGARYEAQVDQGEAIVGALGDVVRNIAALKGQYPR